MEQPRPKPGVSKRLLSCDVIHSFPFLLEASESQTVELGQEGFDVIAELFNSRGDLLLKVDGIGNRGSELVPIFARVGGVYRVKVSSSGCPGDGAYVIKVGPRRVATAEDGKSYEAALAYFRREFRSSADLWGEVGHRRGQADALFKLGQREAELYQWAASQAAFHQALPLYRSLGDRRQEALVMNEIGLACQRLGEVDCAHLHYREAANLARMTEDQILVGDILRNLGMLESQRGEIGKAREKLKEARDVAPGQVSILNALGAVHLKSGDAEGALLYHEAALDRLASSSDVKELGATMTHLGDVYREKNDPLQAERLYRCALKLSGEAGDLRNTATTYNNLGLTFFRSGRWQDASGAYLNAKRSFENQKDPFSAAIAVINIAWVQTAMGKWEEALRLYREVQRLTESSQQASAQAAVHFGVAWTEYQRGNLRQARADVETAIEIIESIRSKADRVELRASYLAGRHNFYELLVEILMGLDRLQPEEGFEVEAFQASDKARSRALLDALEGQPVLPSLTAREVQRELLDEETILLEYFLGERQSYLWVITPTSIASYPLGPGKEIEDLADELHRALASGSVGIRRRALSKAEALGKILLGPVAGRLGHKRLLIVAPAGLQSVPFAVLPDPAEPRAGSFESWPAPLVLRHEIIHLPSAAVLASLRGSRSHLKVLRPRVIVLADPVFSPDDDRLAGLIVEEEEETPQRRRLRRLKSSRREADAIEKAAGLGKVRKVLGLEATRDFILRDGLAGFDVIHFSAHGSPNKEFPALSAIELSRYNENGNSVSGALRAEDIRKLKLSAGLVVLGACSTGLGKEVRGEGLVGLTQAFFTAGASRVLVSLWDIDDHATADLMDQFYSNLLDKELPPAAALREVQIWAWKRGDSPFFWGGFVLQGESR
jgi:CHAT domain-containing protein/Tfp pilus assembly protein PilF